MIQSLQKTPGSLLLAEIPFRNHSVSQMLSKRVTGSESLPSLAFTSQRTREGSLWDVPSILFGLRTESSPFWPLSRLWVFLLLSHPLDKAESCLREIKMADVCSCRHLDTYTSFDWISEANDRARKASTHQKVDEINAKGFCCLVGHAKQ